jgi:hypothetical protein
MDFSTLGKGILILGLVLVLLGGLFWVLGRAGLPLGRLPGDIRIERDGFSCLVPVASMILVSILLTVLLNVVIRLFNR